MTEPMVDAIANLDQAIAGIRDLAKAQVAQFSELTKGGVPTSAAAIIVGTQWGTVLKSDLQE